MVTRLRRKRSASLKRERGLPSPLALVYRSAVGGASYFGDPYGTRILSGAAGGSMNRCTPVNIIKWGLQKSSHLCYNQTRGNEQSPPLSASRTAELGTSHASRASGFPPRGGESSSRALPMRFQARLLHGTLGNRNSETPLNPSCPAGKRPTT